ncbi:MAG TPA: FAD-dependent oxidoreductase [Candidatus Gastranaerophilaceae bacterium]|nr:FAD-dependent oxidoreductase [Candidatus Gastranaerophilaceae bacterium]
MTSDKYDVIIAGGGTAGCAAAYTCANLGLKTLLIEKNIHLGGTMTSGLVIPAMNSSKNQINTDFFNALISELADLKGQITYENNSGWFNPELCKIALDRLMSKSGVEVLFDTRIIGVNAINRKINGVTISSNMLSVYIATSNVIDATGNCEIGKILGCNFLENKNEFQPVSLRFQMSGIDLDIFGKWLLDFDKDKTVTSMHVIDGQVHLSTAYTWDKDKNWALKPIFEDAVTKNVLKDTDRSYFQVFSIPNMPNSLAFNCPRVYFDKEINPLDNVNISKALIVGRESIIRIADFCKIYFPGFEKSYISNIADALGVRVSRRIKGKYVYTVDDLKSGKKFKNPVLISNYPIDVHSNKDGKSILEKTEKEYQLPVEALISADYDNFFVAGRCLSADFFAQAALRIQPSCFSMGEGLAKHIASVVN